MYVCIYCILEHFFCLCLLRLAFMRLVAFFRASFLDGGSLPVYFHIKTPHIFRLSSFFFSCSSFFLLQGRRNVWSLFWQISWPYSNKGDGADSAHHINLSHQSFWHSGGPVLTNVMTTVKWGRFCPPHKLVPPKFLTFRRPCVDKCYDDRQYACEPLCTRTSQKHRWH